MPLVPGSPGAVRDRRRGRGGWREQIGYPVLIKAVGRRRRARHEGGATTPTSWPRPLPLARAEAKAAFGNDAVYLETLPRPAAPHRDPGARRRPRRRRASRRARLLAAAPPPEGARGGALARAQRRAARAASASSPSAAVRKLGYRGAGTIEFLYQDGEFYFIEMNTRLQVEHPVTEMVTGIDLVREQIRIAAGAPLGVHARRTSCFRGHAIECRINAENPRDLPALARPGHRLPSRRAASACASIQRLYAGYAVPPYYDSLVAKLIVHGPSRNECLMRLRRALEEFVIGGIETTIPLHQRHHRRSPTSSTATTTSTGWRSWSA